MPIYQDIPWKRLFVEGTAIVVSILLAFGIDAWWQDRQIRKEEHAKMVYEIHVPYLINEGLSASGAMGFWYDDWSIPARPIASDDEALRNLLNDSRFRSMVEIRYGYRKHLTEEYEAAIAAVDAILTEIERSLD
jgi:hypothetical protein